MEKGFQVASISYPRSRSIPVQPLRKQVQKPGKCYYGKNREETAEGWSEESLRYSRSRWSLNYILLDVEIQVNKHKQIFKEQVATFWKTSS